MDIAILESIKTIAMLARARAVGIHRQFWMHGVIPTAAVLGFTANLSMTEPVTALAINTVYCLTYLHLWTNKTVDILRLYSGNAAIYWSYDIVTGLARLYVFLALLNALKHCSR